MDMKLVPNETTIIIDEVKIYELNTEKKSEAMQRAMKVHLNLMRKEDVELKNCCNL